MRPGQPPQGDLCKGLSRGNMSVCSGGVGGRQGEGKSGLQAGVHKNERIKQEK